MMKTIKGDEARSTRTDRLDDQLNLGTSSRMGLQCPQRLFET